MTTLAGTAGINYLYVTDQTGSDPYAVLPSYYTAENTALTGGGGGGGVPTPGAPVLAVPVVTGTSVALSWSAPANAATYGVNRDNVLVGEGTTETSWTDTGAGSGVPAGTHTYTVFAINSAGTSGPDSNAETATVSSGGGGGGGSYVPNAPATIGGVTVPTTLVFHDEFDTGSLNSEYWGAVTVSGGDNGAAMTPSNVSVGANGLALVTSTATEGGLVTSGTWFGGISGPGYTICPTGGGTQGTSGPVYIEWEATFPISGGSIPAWDALWTTGPTWPEDGEIDVAEHLQGDALQAHVHYGTGSGSAVPSGNSISAGPTTGTFGVLWTTTGQTYVYNGVVVGTTAISTGTMNNSPQCLLMEAGAADSGYPCTLTVRYVRVWQG
jgi:hypothetical protein